MGAAQSFFQSLTVKRGFPSTRNALVVRIIVVVVLLALVFGLSYLHINGTYKPWMKCSHVLGTNSGLCYNWDMVNYIPQPIKDVLNWPGQLCNWFSGACRPDIKCIGIGDLKTCNDVNPLRALGICGWFGQCPGSATLPIPGLAGFINPPLEWLRGLTVRTILVFFVISSMIATILYYIIIKPIKDVLIKLVRGDQETWTKLTERVTTWALILGLFLLLFLFSVYRTGGLELPALPAFLKTLLKIPA